MKSNAFRKELIKIMPRYAWTVHRNMFSGSDHISATGIQSAGFNRLSTLQVTRNEKDGEAEYKVTSSGFGTRAPWLSKYTDGTLARALRGLQNHYEEMSRNYNQHARYLESGRTIPPDKQS